MKQIVRLTTTVMTQRDLLIEVPDDAQIEKTGDLWTIKAPGERNVWVGVQTALDKGLVKLIEVLQWSR
jgi:hypothetical protein